MMNQEIRSFLDDYMGEMLAGNAALFAGAGLSVPAGYVDWKNLIRNLSTEVGLNIEWESDLVAVAQFHVNSNGQNRHGIHKAVIDAISANNPPTRNHELLARLPIETWWTTNYDKLIESALRDAGKTVDVKSATPQLALSRKGRDATLFKMHGDVDRPDDAVATRDDFEKYLEKRGPFINALVGDLVSKTFLFLGFSFTDPNLDHVLTHVRLNFRQNQRRHYAVFRRRTRIPGESEELFVHHQARQLLVVDDLKRYNVKVLLVDEYSDITKFLEELLQRFRRRTVFVSGSFVDADPWGEPAAIEFCHTLGKALIASGNRLATGLGVGVGDAVFTGALREVMRMKESIEETLVLRPFPQSTGGSAEREEIWDKYRRELISHAGIGVFLFGNKLGEAGEVVVADGVRKEYEIAREQGVVRLAIGATGSAARELATDALAEPDRQLSELDREEIEALAAMALECKNLNELIEPLLGLIAKLQGRGAK